MIAGSVSGGCVEAAVISEAMAVLAGNSPKLNELGLDIGLSCGGKIEIFVDRLDRSIDPVLQAIRLALHQQKPLALCTLVSGPNVSAKMAVPGNPNQLVIGSLRLKVNGVQQTLFVEARVTLLDALREHLGLTGTKKGCDRG